YDWQRDARNSITVMSNPLRLDVLTDKPQPYEGLRCDLLPNSKRNAADKQGNLWQIRFTNEGPQPIRFGMHTRGDTHDFSRGLLCYDSKGEKTRVPPPQGAYGQDIRRIEPGKSLLFPIEVPRGTALARMVFF